ncbi:MAG TPA: acetate--CoA ligase family protein [Acidimicrobiia bacterium]|nr:acetate--CoA ligase family protein [Acidimicrobiia bacterium]
MTQRTDPIELLLNPTSVAIVGLSDDPAKHGARVLGHLNRLGFGGEVWGVNPRVPDVPGVEMFPSLRSLPAPPGVVVCAVPAGAVVDVVTEAGRVGAGVVIVFAGGFSESGKDGLRLQERLVAAASTGGVRILGPNSGGVIRPVAGVALSFLTCLDRPVDQIRSGPVALVTQSGGTGSYLHNLAAARGSGLAASISTGNEADLDAADAIAGLVDRPEVSAIAVVLETVRRGPEFVAALRRSRQAGKPVVICRLGRSERGRRLMVTHTGALAGPARVLDGVLDAEGVTIAETPADLLDVAEAMARVRVPGGDRVGVVTHSGGIAILLSDLADEAGVVLPSPGPDLRSRLIPLLELGAADNPLDMGGIIGGPHRFAQVVNAFVSSEDYDMVLAVSTAHPPTHTETRARDLAALDDAKPVVHLWMAGDVGEGGLAILREAGAAVMEEPRAAMAALVGLGRLAAGPAPPPPRVDLELNVAGTLSEHASKVLLGSLGVTVATGDLATTVVEAVEIANAVGYPVVLKLSSSQVSHKTEIGGLRTNIRDDADVRDGFGALIKAGAAVGAVTDGVRVERQMSGLEMIVGAVRDATFGPIVLVGLGGTFTEAFDDVVVAPAPVSRTGALRMVSRLRGRGVLSSSRRGTPPDIDSLASVVVRIGEILANSDLEEIEINPLVWTGTSWVALDALVGGKV